MRKVFLAIACCAFAASSCNNQQAETASTATPAATAPAADSKPAPAEFGDPKYAEIGKQGLANLTSGNIDGWMSSYADNAVYVWNNGDSIAGKEAIGTYWKKRRAEALDSISFTNDIWLPVKVNQPQKTEAPGLWLLSWYEVHAKYKSGKSMSQWIHTLLHFNNDDKIDRVIQFRDNVPILAAMKK